MIMSHAARADAAEGHVILRYMKDRFVNRHAARHHARNIEIARLRCGCQKADMNEYRHVVRKVPSTGAENPTRYREMY